MADEQTNGAAGAAEPQGTQAQFNLQKVYVKDASFEAPNSPAIFNEQTTPALQLNLAQNVTVLGEGVFEVVLGLTLTCTAGEKTAYLAEVKQAGIFSFSGFDARTQDMMLGIYCPNALFPFGRQAISDLVQAGGFPPYLLQPINFEALYAEQLRRRAQEQQPAADTVDASFAQPGDADKA
ncbi:MAG: protein-export chaperone SecB [Gammaproteobacteria bacterium HGW-Gammaproteobacteria-4]|jgi:preprotein translocase subunit SecB|nr:MAG: protein-export chaperone SecB [Gammaproteobacteria bacterium HGW-Gammaproteobacteria-4]